MMDRYNRNVIIKEIGDAGQQKLLDSKVLIAGCGGLGSTVIANMASLGIGTLGIIDNDVVELSNLNRQYIHSYTNIGKYKVDSASSWINNYNPDINVKKYKIRLSESNYDSIIDDYDLVIDCFDSFASKFMLNRICMKKNKILIHGGVSEFYGQVITIFPKESACLRCIFPDSMKLDAPIKGVISPAVTTIASLQSIEAFKVILNLEDLLKNQFLSYDGLKFNFKKFAVNKKVSCPDCS